MKKFFFTFVVLFAVAAYGKDYQVSFSQTKSASSQLTFEITNWGMETVSHDGVLYRKLIFSQNTCTDKEGWAELPFISASVQLPAQKDVELKVIAAEYEDVSIDYPLLPSRGTIYRNQNPDEIPYRIAPQSLTDSYYPEELVYGEEPFIVRDVRGTSVRVFPFQWNAVTKTLRVYKNITVELVESDKPATNPLLKENTKPLREAIGMYESMFINYTPSRYDLTMAVHGDILVITTTRDEAAIEPYITWKREKGYNVSKEVVAQNTLVKELIREKYEANNNLMYVLLVGGWEDIKSETEYFDYTSGTCPKDPMLGCVVGNDNFPDIAIGRMSAESSDHVVTQVNKTIAYEKSPNMEPDWHESFIGIGSHEGPGDDNEIDYTHIQRIYSQRLNPFTYNTHYENYGSSPKATDLTGYINTGASTIAYCGHGSETTFVTTGFSNSHVKSLTNGDKLPFIISVACVNGAFHKTGECFAEAWMRKENGGAAITWMSTMNQPWTPPQRGQDYFYDLLIGGFNYNDYSGQSGISTTEQRTHWGAITVNAVGLMLTESATTGDLNTVKTWTTFGDPSLQLRTKQPMGIKKNIEVLIVGTPFETKITTESGNPVENALVALSQNGVYKSGYTNADGMVTIENPFTEGDVVLVVTAFNTTTIYEAIPCIAPSGDYLVYADYKINDDNGTLDYNDGVVSLDFTVKNLGKSAAKNAPVTLSTEDPYVTVTKGTATFASVSIGGQATITDAFEIAVSGAIPDNHKVQFVVTSSGEGTAKSKFEIAASAPALTITGITVNDSKQTGIVPGALARITLSITNQGHMDAFNTKGIVSTDNSHLDIPVAAVPIGDLAVQETKSFTFYANASSSMPIGAEISLDALFGGNFDFSGKDSFTVFCSDYCAPGATKCDGDDVITSFILEEIDNTNSKCNTGGYSDFTEMSATLIPGNTHEVKIKCGYKDDRVKGWLDFNGNKIFEEDEMVFYVVANAGGQELKAEIAVPEDAIPGEYRLRVRLKYKTDPDGPCESWGYGQTHDYTVVVAEKYPRVENLSVLLNGGDVALSWNEPINTTSSMNLTGYTITRNDIPMTSEPLERNRTSFEDENVEDGVYVYKVFAVYEEGVSAPQISEIVAVNRGPLNLNVSANKEQTALVLTWDASEVAVLGYNIYKDGQLLNTEPIKEATYADSDITSVTATYCYSVTTVYSYTESAHSEVVCSPVGISKTEEDSFRVYPNPVHNILKLSGNVIPDNIHIYNLTGQVVYYTDNCNADMSISVKSLPAGVYFLRIEAEGAKVTKKIIVQ